MVVDEFVKNVAERSVGLVIEMKGRGAPLVIGSRSGIEIVADDACPDHRGAHQFIVSTC